MKTLVKKIIIEKHKLTHTCFVDVVRCDVVEGGFKKLAIDGVYIKSQAHNLVFATNSYGAGSIAFTISSKNSRKRPIIFLSKRDKLSPSLILCKKNGAQLDFSGEAESSDSFTLRNEAIKKYNVDNYEVLPLGLENDEVQSNMISLAQKIFNSSVPKEIWIATASGFTIRSLQIAFPETSFNAVLVKGNNPNVGKANIYRPKENFEEIANIRPPYPSNPNYDAKVWGVLLNYNNEYRIKDGTTIFNIA